MRNNRLTRILALILALLMCFTSCAPTLPPSECVHSDIEPKDSICDFCEEEMPASPGDETPGDETPGDETPGDETPGDETPGDETPGDETPGDETPGGDGGTTTPGGDNAGGDSTGSGSTGGDGGTTTPGGDDTTSGDDDNTGSDELPDINEDEGFEVRNNNIPEFTEDDYITVSFEFYGDLDSLGRCTLAFACIGIDIMPDTDEEDRDAINSITPTGFFQIKYDTSIVPGGYIWNRSHLIAWSLAGENANEKNLITGTQYMNQRVMTKFEAMVRAYVKESENHVLYRVTPVFEGDNLVASGVIMEAWSVEDNGEGICFNVYIPNVQEGIYIDYTNGHTCIEGEQGTYDRYFEENPDGVTYIINKNSGVVHLTTCKNLPAEYNRVFTTESLKAIATRLGEGNYKHCTKCNPQNDPNALKTTSYILFVPFIEKEKRVA